MPSEAQQKAAFISATSSSNAYFFVPKAPVRSRFSRLWWPLACPISCRPVRYQLIGSKKACGGEIGRASGRERVLSVRVDLGGRRLINKTKKANHTNTYLR